MEINFQTHHHHKEEISMKKVNKFIKGRKRSNSSNSNSKSNKFVGVRQRSSGKWIAEIKDTTHKKIRMWLGTFETAEDAARAYDEAACLLRGSNTRTNFVTTPVSADSQLAYRIKNLLDSKKIGKQNKQRNSVVFASTCSEKIQESHEKVVNSCDDDDNNLYKPTTIATTMTQSQISCDRLYESSLTSTCLSSEANNNNNNDDDLYKPDMMSCSSSCTSQGEMSWGFEFGQELFDFRVMDESISEMGCTEFERMKVERQISASLYAVNGVQEYMENVHDLDDLSLWDFPPLCSLLS